MIQELSAAFGLAPATDLNAVIQHDNLSEQTALNLRLRHTFAPRRDVFLVLGRTSDTVSGGLVPLESGAILKIAWTMRY